jgi:hypothetical protein
MDAAAEPPPIVSESATGSTDAGASPVGAAGTDQAPSAPSPAASSPGGTPPAATPTAPSSLNPSASGPGAAAPPSTTPPAATPDRYTTPWVRPPVWVEKEVADRPILELGLGAFLMVGGGAGSYLGLAPFLVDELGQGVFLRPSLAIGQSAATNVSSTFAAARADTCARVPGRYASGTGIQLDLCGGAEVGFSYVASGTLVGTPAEGKTLPYVDIGPSAGLRAEVGGLALTLRGFFGLDVAREGFADMTGARVDAPLVSWRLESDVSWDVHRSASGAGAKFIAH